MLKNQWRAIAIAGIASALVAAGAGVASAGSNDTLASQPGAQFLSADGIEKALVAEQQSFPFALPDEIQWPRSVPEFMKDPEASYDEGVARAVVTFYWVCAWEDVYLTAASSADSSTARAALSEVSKFTRTTFYAEQFIDPDGDWEKSVIDAAKRGDSHGLRDHFSGGDCGFYRSATA